MKKIINSNKIPLPRSIQEPMQKDRVALLSAAHFINDIYPGFIPPLLPLLMSRVGFGLSAAGVLVSIMSVFNSLAQPFFGHIADRSKTPYLVIFGPMVTAVFMGFIGFLNSYESILLFVILSSLGTAAFHPQAAVYAGRAGGNKSGLGMSIFVTGGSAGHALGPIIIVPIVTLWGLKSALSTVFLGLTISVILFYTLPKLRYISAKDSYQIVRNGYARPRYAIAFLWIIVTIRAFIICAFITFLPIYLHNKSYSLFLSGSAITVFELSGSVGALVAGSMSDFFGRKKIIVFSLVFALPGLFLFLKFTGILSFVFLAAAGLFIYSSIPVAIIMAQELFPARVNTVSSFMMGVSWGVGGLLVAPFGILADKIGIQNAMVYLIYIGIMAAIAAMFLPETYKVS
ncbi:MFS transporter [candidate division KSB1 bacterium]|nr:MFS transporter [candidate division KSB1 bacterium]